jgi:hypothetical protein
MASSGSTSSSPTIYTYFIRSHGAIVRKSDDNNIPKIIGIDIPDGIELFTYTDLGKTNWLIPYTLDYVCKKEMHTHQDSTSFLVKTPISKYIKKFPQLYLQPDARFEPWFIILKKDKPLFFYSGIVHCIPESNRKSKQTREVIHNMDADPLKDCSDNSIHPKIINLTTKAIAERQYKSDEKYSEYYKKVLKTNGNNRESPLQLINKCGALYLSEAIAIIRQHCEETYQVDYIESIIQIHIDACLVLMAPIGRVQKDDYAFTELDIFNSYQVPDTLMIKDTKHTLTYLYRYVKSKFLIRVVKPIGYDYGVMNDTNGLMVSHALIKAVDKFISELKEVKSGFPRDENIEIFFPYYNWNSDDLAIWIYNDLRSRFQDKLIRKTQSTLIPASLDTPGLMPRSIVSVMPQSIVSVMPQSTVRMRPQSTVRMMPQYSADSLMHLQENTSLVVPEKSNTLTSRTRKSQKGGKQILKSKRRKRTKRLNKMQRKDRNTILIV